jgi:hypothetical protein
MGDSRWPKINFAPVDSTWMRRSLANGSRARASHASRARAGRSRQCQSKWAGSTRRCTRTALVTAPFLICTIQAFSALPCGAPIIVAAIRSRSAATGGKMTFGCPTSSRGAGHAVGKVLTSVPTSTGRRRPDARRCPDDTTSGRPNRDRGTPV